MPATALGPIIDAAACARRLTDVPWEGVATYVLWDRETQTPIYCGTAVSRSRLKSHLTKDDPASPVSSHNKRNPELVAYWQSRPKGWLGVSFAFSSTAEEAKELERRIIRHYGIRSQGGLLFNQRVSG